MFIPDFFNMIKNDSLFNSSKYEKDYYAEFFTPYSLRDEILTEFININPDFFKNKNVKILEPTCGKGAFVFHLIYLLFINLRDLFDSDLECYHSILLNNIYYNDINPDNITFINSILDPDNKLNLNNYCIDFNLFDSSLSFDLIISNPPFNKYRERSNGLSIYKSIVFKSFEFLNENGFMIMIHPIMYRSPVFYKKSKFKDLRQLLIDNNHMLYLKMFDYKKSKKYFNAMITVDSYILKKTNIQDDYFTRVIFMDDIEKNICLKYLPFIPNSNFDLINSLFTYNLSPYKIEKGFDIRDKKKYSLEKNETFNIPMIKSINLKGIEYYYLHKDLFTKKESFDSNKILLNVTSCSSAHLDLNHLCYAHNIICFVLFNPNDISYYNKLLTFFKSDTFKTIFKSCIFSSFQVSEGIFYYLDFSSLIE